MARFPLACLACFLAAISTVSAVEDESIKARMAEVRKAYNIEQFKYRCAVSDYFKTLEDAAEAKGDQAAVDRIKAER